MLATWLVVNVCRATPSVPEPEPVPTAEDSEGVGSTANWPEAPEQPAAPRGELAGLPAIAGNDTFGFLFGVTGSYTRFAPQFAPFRFRLQLTAVTSVLGTDSGVRWPLQNIDLRLDFPGLLSGRLRIFALMRYQRIQNVGYWGVGNGADGRIPSDYEGPRDQFFTYEKQLGEGRVFMRYRIAKSLDFVSGVGLRLMHPEVIDGTRLVRDLQPGSATRPLLFGYTNLVVADVMGGLLLDTRDDEFNPSAGGYHELSLRIGGGPSDDGKIRYGSLYVHTRWFLPLFEQYLVLALRGLGDLGVGSLPLIELGSIGGYFQVAGPAGIEANRGLPYGRQLGRVKVLTTVELRSTFYRFKLGRQRLALGAAAFVDGSRVWSQFGKTPGLDGGPFMRFSYGGGPRITWGRALVLRVDVGVGPGSDIDGTTNVSGTLALGQVF